MAVAFDAKSTAWTNVSGVATLSHSLITVGSGTNRALVACLVFSNGSVPSGLTVTWDSGGASPQTMTAVANTTVSDGVLLATIVLYGLVNPNSGAKTLTASWTGSLEAHLVAVSFTGVNQAGGVNSFAHGVTQDQSAQTSGSITVTCPTGDMAVACFSNNVWTFATTSGSIIQFQNTGPNDGSVALSQSGAGSTVCTCSGGSSAGLVSSALDVVAASGVSIGIPPGTIFVPGVRFGPTHGLRPTQAFPPIIPPPGPGIPPGTIFAPVSRFGPTRGLRPTQAFPPALTVTTAALAAFAGMMVKGAGAPTGAAAMRGLGLFEVKASAQPSGKVPLLAAANAQLKAQAAPSFKAALLGRAAAMVKAFASPTGVVPLLARATTMAKALAQPSGVVPLLGSAVAMLKTQSSFTAFFALTARLTTQFKAQATATGAAAMAARATAMTMARGSASGVVGLFGAATAMVRSSGPLLGIINLLGRATMMVRSSASPTGALGLAARAAAKVFTTSTLTASAALGALSSRVTIQVKAMQSSISTSGIAKAVSGMWLIRARRRNKR